ncbi:hypothetical protein [Demequina sp. NBRC 110054]|uniref:hypothetical protein n=1 Tax=Demequina sp. NBRC 110054 TaxID=1570343 RepID=UPI000A010B5E|nr:hypothetical protein [Demequina sp. NBRC 110054]
MKALPDGVELASLALDPENPRLPDAVQNTSQADLLTYLYKNDVLDELAASFVANDYFPNEPVLVLPPNDEGMRIVVEGNRRAATLMILAGAPTASAAGLEFDLAPTPTEEQLSSFSVIPAVEVEDRDELKSYLGYRHIGGILPWSAEAKARWIYQNVNEQAAAGSQRPFYDVGRMLGSNSLGVRNRYLAWRLLREARTEGGAETSYVEGERFSVWGLLAGSDRLKGYIGIDRRVSEFADVEAAFESIDMDKVVEIVRDLSPVDGRRPVLSDSRDVGTYVDVISDERASQLLRKYGDLELAASTLERGALTERLQTQARELEALATDARRLDVDESTLDAAQDVFETARSIRAVVKDRVESDD